MPVSCKMTYDRYKNQIEEMLLPRKFLICCNKSPINLAVTLIPCLLVMQALGKAHLSQRTLLIYTTSLIILTFPRFLRSHWGANQHCYLSLLVTDQKYIQNSSGCASVLPRNSKHETFRSVFLVFWLTPFEWRHKVRCALWLYQDLLFQCKSPPLS